MVPLPHVTGEHAPASSRYPWLTADAQTRVRAVLFGIALFFGLVVWVWHSFGPVAPQSAAMLRKLRVAGAMTCVYALVQLLDMRFYHSRAAARRLASTGIPESVLAWLFAQMMAWVGIVYYGLTEDPRPYVAALVVHLVIFWVFPVEKR